MKMQIILNPIFLNMVNLDLETCPQFNYQCFDDVVLFSISYYISCFYTHFCIFSFIQSVVFKKKCKLNKKHKAFK
jgi:hypothetical protein